MPKSVRRAAMASVMASLAPLSLMLVPAGTASASAAVDSGAFTVTPILYGTELTHTFIPAGSTARVSASLTNPDDITVLGSDLFVGFQNGVGPQGQASSIGNLNSTIVEIGPDGTPLGQWDIRGKADGVTADPLTDQVIATVNEDAHSSLYVINPTSNYPPDKVRHYRYNEPLPHLGGTDAISIYKDQIFISASAPGTTGAAAPQPTYPAVYSVSLDPATQVATVTPVFYDEATAKIANVGSGKLGEPVKLSLTDPDSNEVVPAGARFGGDFMLTSQGDLEQIYLSEPKGPSGPKALSVLGLTQSVDDTAWPTARSGILYATDSTNDAVDAVVGSFAVKSPIVVATPCGANSAPANCPDPPTWPANYLAALNPDNGLVTPLTLQLNGASFTPQGGLTFIPF